MITVFNSLTNKKLKDCNLFENILSYHFEKFRYFYYIIRDIDLKKVNKIDCSETPSCLFIYINFKSKKNKEYFLKIIEKENQDCLSQDTKYSKCFNLSINNVVNDLNISIENKNNYREDDD
jgi:hypothetical protein